METGEQDKIDALKDKLEGLSEELAACRANADELGATRMSYFIQKALVALGDAVGPGL